MDSWPGGLRGLYPERTRAHDPEVHSSVDLCGQTAWELALLLAWPGMPSHAGGIVLFDPSQERASKFWGNPSGEPDGTSRTIWKSRSARWLGRLPQSGLDRGPGARAKGTIPRASSRTLPDSTSTSLGPAAAARAGSSALFMATWT
jgi:hypothetical protein